MSERVTDAVIVMAGVGLAIEQRRQEEAQKPLVQLPGGPLISYTLDALAAAGIDTVYAVIGYESHTLRAAIQAWIPPKIDIHWIDNPQWQLKNGVSVLAAAGDVSAPFLLTMGDHLFDGAIVDLLLRESKLDRLNVAIDRKLDTIFDLADAMKLHVENDRVIAIGKDLENYNAIDTGLFVCPVEFFNYLEKAKVNGDCSLADGVRAMAADGLVRGIDIGSAWWQDIDTPEMLASAEEQLRSRRDRLAGARSNRSNAA